MNLTRMTTSHPSLTRCHLRLPPVQVADEFDEDDHFTPISHPVPPATAFTSIPCGVCPVFSECRDDGVVSPATCEYFNAWLQF